MRREVEPLSFSEARERELQALRDQVIALQEQIKFMSVISRREEKRVEHEEAETTEAVATPKPKKTRQPKSAPGTTKEALLKCFAEKGPEVTVGNLHKAVCEAGGNNRGASIVLPQLAVEVKPNVYALKEGVQP